MLEEATEVWLMVLGQKGIHHAIDGQLDPVAGARSRGAAEHRCPHGRSPLGARTQTVSLHVVVLQKTAKSPHSAGVYQSLLLLYSP